MIKYILPVCFLLAPMLIVPAQAQRENFQYLVDAQSLNGYTGNIITPSPYTTARRKFSFGLHKFNIGINYGITSDLEAGMYLNLNELSPSSNGSYENIASTAIALNAKYKIIKQFDDAEPFDFSAGLYQKTIYFVLGRQFNELYDLNFESGVDIYLQEKQKMGYFFSITKAEKYSNFILDYKSYTGQANIGWRVLLSPDVKLDLFLINIENFKSTFDNFMFGLTLTS